MKQKSPFNTFSCNGIALLFTILICSGVKLLVGSSFAYWDFIINGRGPLVQIGLFFMFRSVAAYYIARFSKRYPPWFQREFLVYAFFPVYLALCGFLFALGAPLSGMSEFLAGAAEFSQVKEVLGNVFIGMSMAFDMPLANLLCGLVCFVFYCQVLALPKPADPVAD